MKREFNSKSASKIESLCCMADENALAKVLDQLLSNAIKFSETGGGVIVTGASTEAGVVLEVTDHGIGMVSEDVERAMSSFSQIDQNLARKYEGVGLGLPLARALIDLLGGGMAIRSAPDEGTTVETRVAGSASILRRRCGS